MASWVILVGRAATKTTLSVGSAKVRAERGTPWLGQVAEVRIDRGLPCCVGDESDYVRTI